jgi:transposase
MATERLPMRNIREVLRLRWRLGLTVREAARSLGVSSGVVSKTAARATTAGLTWAVVESLDDATLEERLYGRPVALSAERARPDPIYIHTELRRPGVTLELLHLEYLEQHPEGLRYTAFCDVYRHWRARAAVTMRQVHKAGEKCFVDYSGVLASYFDGRTGEAVDVEIFVAVLGASNYTFAEATATQRVADFVASHERAFAYFGGVPEIVVPDQLKSGVVIACRYEPAIQRTYGDMARHYGTAIVPARPYKPRDKAKVEVAVQIAQRWILARLRRETHFSLASLNTRIRELLDELNARPMKKLGGVSRRELFDRLERPVLRALPAERFEYGEWSHGRVGLDYHVEVSEHWYSAPYGLAKEQVWSWSTATMIHVFHREERVALHVRSDTPHGHTTDPAHMPEAHRRHAGGADAVLAWATAAGPMTEAMARRLIDANPVHEIGWRSARGLQRISEKYGAERTELACARALRLGARSYKTVANILALNRESIPLPGEEPAEAPIIVHENVRGPGYYH